MGKKRAAESGRVHRINELLLSETPDEYQLCVGQFKEVRDLLHEHLAERLAAPLNDCLAACPHATLSEKQELARWLNAELRGLGLAIRCPKTGGAAILHADSGHDSSVGRFQIALMDSESKHKRTLSSSNLPELALMPAPLRKEPLAEYWAKMARTDGKTGQRPR